MVEVVKISKEGYLLEIKEVPDVYRLEPASWVDALKKSGSVKKKQG